MSNLYTPPAFPQSQPPPKASVNDVLLKEAQQEINQLRDELFQAKRTAWQKTKDLEELNKSKQQLSQQVQALGQQVQQLEKDAVWGKGLSEEVISLRENVDNLSKENEQLKEARRILQQELVEERNARETIESQKGLLESERSRLLHESDGLKSEVKFLKRRIHEVEEELVTAEQEAVSLRTEVRGGASTTSSDIQRQASLSRAKSLELQEEKAKVDKLSKQIISHQQEIEQLQTVLENSQQLQSQQPPSSNVSQSIENAPQKLQEMERKVIMFKKSRDKLLAEVDTQSVEIDRLLSENYALSNSLRECEELQNKWKMQAEDSLVQIEKLKDMMEESASWVVVEGNITSGETEYQKKVSFLEQELVQGRAKIAKMDLQIRALCAEYTKAAQYSGTLQASMLPVLNGIEGRLMRLKNDQILPQESVQ
eukprot:TRINITY_DN713_c0_g1_i2.p1 TRINITY_DN713_c0_g1~~TRINITY_DN713_c0_g1_i2.p1  ORF type:complete len:426 (-),score=70.30 TRINITY_DN713_c0_g1_i2:667-1944(-)